MARQFHKSIYFEDYTSKDGKAKTFSIAFSEDEKHLYQRIAGLSSIEIKNVIGYSSYNELKKAAVAEGRTVNQFIKRQLSSNPEGSLFHSYVSRDVTFSGSKAIPFQRWYPYIEGYSPSFVISLIEEHCPDATLIYEPFAGTGTTMFSADMMGISCVYSEVNPLLQFLIKTKLSVLKLSKQKRAELSEQILDIANTIISKASNCPEHEDLKACYSATFGKSKYFDAEQYSLILKLRSYIEIIKTQYSAIHSDIVTIAILSSLIPVSYLKKQGDLRFKTPAEMKSATHFMEDVLPEKLRSMASDIIDYGFSLNKSHKPTATNAKLIGDAKLKNKISAVITSPPYLNGTNYFRNTKLELWFLGHLKKDSDLRHYRDEALTSGINDVKQEYASAQMPFSSEILEDALDKLVRNAYDKRIPLMAKSYFKEMYEVFAGLRKHLANNACILIDLGDSIFSNVHIKTDFILIDILKQLGYTLQARNVLRQRRSRNGELLSQVLLHLRYSE